MIRCQLVQIYQINKYNKQYFYQELILLKFKKIIDLILNLLKALE